MATSWLNQVRLASTGSNLSLSGLATLDGQSLSAGDRVLAKDQTSAPENGVYVAASGAWTRAADFSTGTGVVTPELSIRVSEGTLNAHSEWFLATQGPIDVGTTGLSFAPAMARNYATLASAGAVSAGMAVCTSGTTVVPATTSAIAAAGFAIAGVLLVDASNDNMAPILTNGILPPSVFNLGSGVACAVGVTATGIPERVTEPSMASGLTYLGTCDADGTITVNPRRSPHHDVKDYGAKGDNTTDDTDAFESAFDAVLRTAGSVYVPAGKYKLSRTLVIPPFGGSQPLVGFHLYGAGQEASQLLWSELVNGIQIQQNEVTIEHLTLYNEPCYRYYDIFTYHADLWKENTPYSAGTVLRGKGAMVRLLRCTQTGMSGSFVPYGRLCSGAPNAYATSNPGINRTDPIVWLSGAPNASFSHIWWNSFSGGPIGTMSWYYSTDDYVTILGPYPTYAGISKYPFGPTTTVSSGSNGAQVSTLTTLNVTTTAGAISSGTLVVADNAGVGHLVNYTGVTPTSFTGCTCATSGVLATGGAVQYSTTGLYVNLTDGETTTTSSISYPTSTIPVAATANFTVSDGGHGLSSQITIGGQTLSYGGITANSFTGVTGWTGSGSIPSGSAVSQAYPSSTLFGSPAHGTGFSHVIGDVLTDGTCEWEVINGPVGLLCGPNTIGHCRVKDCFISSWSVGVLWNGSETCSVENCTVGGTCAVWACDGSSFFSGPYDVPGYGGNTNVNAVRDCDISSYSTGIACGGGFTLRVTGTNFEIISGTVGFADSWPSWYFYTTGGAGNTYIDTVEGEGAHTSIYGGFNAAFIGSLSYAGIMLKVSNALLVPQNKGPWFDATGNIGSQNSNVELDHCELYGGDLATGVPIFKGMAGVGGMRIRDCSFPTTAAPFDNEFTAAGSILTTEFVGQQPLYSEGGAIGGGMGIGGWAKAGLDLNRNLAIRSRPLTHLAAGRNDNIADSSGTSFRFASVYEVTSPAADFEISGLKAGVEGQLLTLVNLTGYTMTLINESGDSDASNRIWSSTNTDVSLPTPVDGFGQKGFSSATLRYSAARHRWLYTP